MRGATVGVGVVLVASLILGDGDRVLVRGLAYAVVAILGASNLWGRTRWTDLLDFWILVLTCGVFAVSNVLRFALPAHSVGELLNGLAGVLLLMAGAVFIRRRRPGRTLPLLLDGLMVGLLCGLAAREVAVLTTFGPGLDTRAALLMVVGLVGVSLWLRVLSASSSSAVRAFALSAGLAIVANLFVVLGGMDAARPWYVDAFTLASTLVLLYALSHPDITGEMTVPLGDPQRVTVPIIVLMAVALAAAPGVVWLRITAGVAPDPLVGAILSMLALLWAMRAALVLNDRHDHQRWLGVQLQTDPLTGVASRRRVMEHLEALLAAGSADPIERWVMFIDLDRFKSVNDDHGHVAGDQLLIEVARRLRDTVGDDGMVARLSGDEFAIITSTDPELLKPRLMAALDGRIALDAGPSVSVGMSVGVARILPEDTGASTVLARADHAMYRMKKARRQLRQNQLLVATGDPRQDER